MVSHYIGVKASVNYVVSFKVSIKSGLSCKQCGLYLELLSLLQLGNLL